MEPGWRSAVRDAAARWETPFYLFRWGTVLDALREINDLKWDIPPRQFLSFKSQPLRSLVRQWMRMGLGVEVVSRFELSAALSEGYRPETILVNGVAKHHWLANFSVDRLNVNVDSVEEARHLAPLAVRHQWRIGLRLSVKTQYDPDEVQFSTQFGLSVEEAAEAVREFAICNNRIEILHFHLKSNIIDLEEYSRAIDELTTVSWTLGLTPSVVDCGGGLPCPGDVHDSRAHNIDLQSYATTLSGVCSRIPSVRELWLENGRFLTGRAGCLVLSILDTKERPECRYLICDGGRTNHALVSDWETHNVFTIPDRNGTKRLTTICGPTCMAFDRLCRLPLPSDLNVGDLIVWENAGAYHIPWETRFSHGFAKVVWQDAQGKMVLCRKPESFEQWWLGH